MKKIVSLIIALALCLGLCACGAAGTTAATGTDGNSIIDPVHFVETLETNRST